MILRWNHPVLYYVDLVQEIRPPPYEQHPIVKKEGYLQMMRYYLAINKRQSSGGGIKPISIGYGIA